MGAHVMSVLYPVVMGVMWGTRYVCTVPCGDGGDVGAHVMSVLYPVVMGVMWGYMLCLYCTLW